MIVMDKIRHTTNLLRPMDLTLLCVPVKFETTMLCTWQSKSYGKPVSCEVDLFLFTNVEQLQDESDDILKSSVAAEDSS